MPPGTIVPMGAYYFYCVRMYVCTCVCMNMYVFIMFPVRLKFLVKVLLSFKGYLMLPRHFRWTVWMLNFDTMTQLEDLFLVNAVFGV